MKKSFGQYRRLARGMFGMSSVWMGKDHLVYVRGSGFLIPFTERYFRFRYQDIKFLAVAETSRTGMTVLLALGLLVFTGAFALILALRDAATPPGPVALTFLSLFAAAALVFLTLLLRHFILGPTCVCDLQTSMNRQRLSPLNRLHLARQALELLGDVVAEKQAHLVTGATPSDSEGRVLRSGEDRLRVPKTVLPAFLGYTACGLLVLGMLHLESPLLCAAALLFAILGNIFMATSLIRSVRHPSPGSIRTLLFSLLSAVMIFGGIALVYFIQVAYDEPAFTVGLTGPFEAFAGIPRFGGMIYYFLFLVATLLILGIAIAGWTVALRWQQRLRQIGESETEEPQPEGGSDE